VGGLPDADRMVRVLRLGDDELAADQLDAFTLEDTQLDETLVLDALPSPECQRRLFHDSTVIVPTAEVNVPEPRR
jgi:hypothetical protein